MQARKRSCMYVVACDTKKGLATIGDYVENNNTYAGAILDTINKALRRIKTGSEVHLHTSNNIVIDMITNWIDEIAERGFCKKNGDPVANRDEWHEYWDLTKNMIIIPEPGPHTFSSWMSRELFKHETKLAKEADKEK